MRRRLSMALAACIAAAAIVILAYGTGSDPVPKPAAGEPLPDMTGYTPDWATQKNQSQMLWRCLEAVAPGYEPAADYGWCGQYVGRILDSAERQYPIVDPKWAAGMKSNEALAACRVFEPPNATWWCGMLALMTNEDVLYPELFSADTGHTPDWAADTKPGDAIITCFNVPMTLRHVNTDRDADWCGQYAEHILYHSLDPSDTVIADSTGHMPDWAAGIGPGQAHSECLGPVQGADADWCAEFVPLYAFSLCHGIYAGYLNSGERWSGEIGTCAEYVWPPETDGA